MTPNATNIFLLSYTPNAIRCWWFECDIQLLLCGRHIEGWDADSSCGTSSQLWGGISCTWLHSSDTRTRSSNYGRCAVLSCTSLCRVRSATAPAVGAPLPHPLCCRHLSRVVVSVISCIYETISGEVHLTVIDECLKDSMLWTQPLWFKIRSATANSRDIQRFVGVLLAFLRIYHRRDASTTYIEFIRSKKKTVRRWITEIMRETICSTWWWKWSSCIAGGRSRRW